jgi:hypothetical protein
MIGAAVAGDTVGDEGAGPPRRNGDHRVISCRAAHPRRRSLFLFWGAFALIAAAFVAACGRPIDRPRDGARPIAVGASPGRLLPEPPPTLAPATTLIATPVPPPAPSPVPAIVASPARSPGVYPIISNIQPAPGAALPPGDVVIGARVTGSSNLTTVLALVDGEPFQPPLGDPPGRSLSFSFVRELAAGPHEVRIEARDEAGQTGGYRWQFTVGPRQAPPLPTASGPLPTLVVPTRAASTRPSVQSSPSPKPTSR